MMDRKTGPRRSGDGRNGDSRSSRPERSSGGGGGGGGGYERGGGRGGLKPMPALDDIEATKKKFTGRCRLFVGNMPNDMTEEELKELFSDYGEIAECYMSGKGFAFIRLDTRAHAEAAKEALDNKSVRNRTLRVRFAVHGASLKVKELSPYVSNELLFQAFSQFGEVERAVHIVDEKGRPIGEGIVEFARKGGALETMNRLGNNVFLLTGDPRPVTVEFLEARDEEDGLSERMCQKNAQYQREREHKPRFPPDGSFEHDYGLKWKELYSQEKAMREELETQMIQARQRLEGEMDLAYQDYQTAQLREDLRRRQDELDRLEASKRERMEMFSGRGSGGYGGGPFGGGGMGGGGMGGGGMGGGGMGGGGMGGFGGVGPRGGMGGPMGGPMGGEMGDGFGNGPPRGFGAPPDVFGSAEPVMGGAPDQMGGGVFGSGNFGGDGGRSSEVNQLMNLFKGGPGDDESQFNQSGGSRGFAEEPLGFGRDREDGFGRRDGGGSIGRGRRGGGSGGPDYAPPKRRR